MTRGVSEDAGWWLAAAQGKIAAAAKYEPEENGDTYCQLAAFGAELALKAVTVAHGAEFPETHSIGALVKCLEKISEEPPESVKAARFLTRYSGREKYLAEETRAEDWVGPAAWKRAYSAAKDVTDWAAERVPLIDKARAADPAGTGGPKTPPRYDALPPAERPGVEAGAEIAPDAFVARGAVIDKDSTVGTEAVIRERTKIVNSRIGAGAEMMPGAAVHNSEIGNRVRIEEGALVTGSKIGAHSHVRRNSVTKDAEFSRHSVIAAKSSVLGLAKGGGGKDEPVVRGRKQNPGVEPPARGRTADGGTGTDRHPLTRESTMIDENHQLDARSELLAAVINNSWHRASRKSKAAEEHRDECKSAVAASTGGEYWFLAETESDAEAVELAVAYGREAAERLHENRPGKIIGSAVGAQIESMVNDLERFQKRAQASIRSATETVEAVRETDNAKVSVYREIEEALATKKMDERVPAELRAAVSGAADRAAAFVKEEEQRRSRQPPRQESTRGGVNTALSQMAVLILAAAGLSTCAAETKGVRTKLRERVQDIREGWHTTETPRDALGGVTAAFGVIKRALGCDNE